MKKIYIREDIKDKINKIKNIYKCDVILNRDTIKKSSDILQYVLFLEFVLNIELNRKIIDKELINCCYDTIDLCYNKYGSLICGK